MRQACTGAQLSSDFHRLLRAAWPHAANTAALVDAAHYRMAYPKCSAGARAEAVCLCCVQRPKVCTERLIQQLRVHVQHNSTVRQLAQTTSAANYHEVELTRDDVDGSLHISSTMSAWCMRSSAWLECTADLNTGGAWLQPWGITYMDRLNERHCAQCDEQWDERCCIACQRRFADWRVCTRADQAVPRSGARESVKQENTHFHIFDGT